MEDTRFIRLDLNRFGQYTFRSSEELLEWLKTQVQAFPAFKRLISNDYADRNNLIVHLQNIVNDRTQFEPRKAEVIELIESNAAVICPLDSAPGKFLQSLYEENPELAAGAYGTISGRFQANTDRAVLFEGRIRGIVFLLGVGESRVVKEVAEEFIAKTRSWAASAREEVAQLTNSMQETVQEIASFRESRLAQEETDKASLSERLSELRADQSAKLVDHKKQLDEWIDMSKARLQALEETYSKKLALHAPVEYWSSKKRGHILASVIFGIAFVAALVLVGLFLVGQVEEYLLVGNAAATEAGAGWESVPFGRIGVTLLIVTLGLWFIRTLARLFLSNLHIATDAGERVVMVKTYLALKAEGAGLDEHEKEVIFQALFRKAATGIVKDDANPPSMLSSVLRRPESS